jgi:hypothetical protein
MVAGKLQKQPDSSINKSAPEWRNWQTRWTQNPVIGDNRVGSIPSSGMPYFTLFSVS